MISECKWTKLFLQFCPVIQGVKTVETDEGYRFQYDPDYLQLTEAHPVSLTLPLTVKPYQSTVLFPFFDGLIPEGWLLDIAERNWKLQANDRFGLLLACCQDCIGAVSIIPVPNNA